MSYKKPQTIEIDTDKLCEYGCGNNAKYQFQNRKICCSPHYNSCQGKRNDFSKLDHTERTAKSLATRTELGITRSSQVKAGATRKANKHYEKLAHIMREKWASKPWDNNAQCPILDFKNTGIVYQGTYEFEFLEELEEEHGLEWISQNVTRGPNIWYIDPTDGTKKLYIGDFLIHNTVYEIKSSWTWNKHGKDLVLETRNKAKLTECVNQNYKVILVLNQKRITYERAMDGTLSPDNY
jgi:hypothetical protein